MSDNEKLLRVALICVVEQLQEAHNSMTDDGENCDGGCSFEDGLAIGNDALNGITNSLIEGRFEEIEALHAPQASPPEPLND